MGGMKGYKHTVAARRKISAALRLRWKQPGFIERRHVKASNSAKKMWQRKDYRDKASVWQSRRAERTNHKKQGQTLRKTWANPKKNMKLLIGVKKRASNIDACMRQSMSLKEFYRDLSPEEKQDHLKHWIEAGQLASGKKVKNTSIEVKLQQALRSEGIKFKLHPTMFGVPDIYFPKQKLCVFCDGEYWHNQPKRIMRDKQVSRTLRKSGYKVLRLKGQTILKRSKYCVARIKQML